MNPMYADTSPSKARLSGRDLPRMNGFARVGFKQKNGCTRLSILDQRNPIRVLFPRPETRDLPLAAITTVSGGLVGGDSLDMAVTVGNGAKAIAFGQAAEKVYRSAGPDSVVDVRLDVAADAWLEWLPQETILFDGARLCRNTKATINPAGRLMAGECLVFGRLARGEIMRRGIVRDRWEIRVAGRLVWADALVMEEDIVEILDTPAGFHGARAYATAIYVGPDAPDHIEAAKCITNESPNVRAGATCVGGVLVARWLSEDPLALRDAFGTYWKAMRAMTGGLPSRLPRLWYV
jgi:urease accessory protein